MKKINSGIILLNMALFAACHSTPDDLQPIVLDKISIQGDVPIYSVSAIIDKKYDKDGLGETGLRNILVREIRTIKESLRFEGIQVDADTFLNEYFRSPHIQFEEIRVEPGNVLHHYYWNAPVQTQTRLELMLMVGTTNDGSVPVHAYVIRSNRNFEHGYVMERLLYLPFPGR